MLFWAERHLPGGLENAGSSELIGILGQRDWSIWTRHTYDGHIRTFYDWAVENEYLTCNPMAKIRRPKSGESVPNPCTTAELEHALANLPEPWNTAALLASHEGLRCCELARFDRSHLTEANVRVVHGKGGRDAMLPTHPRVWAALCDREASADPRRPRPILRNRCGRPVSPGYLHKSEEWFSRIDLPGMHLHRLRSWFGTELRRRGADLLLVQRLMRHKSPTSTAGYVQVADSEGAVAVNLLSAVGAPAEL